MRVARWSGVTPTLATGVNHGPGENVCVGGDVVMVKDME